MSSNNEKCKEVQGSGKGMVVSFDTTLHEDIRAIVIDLDGFRNKNRKLFRKVSSKAFVHQDNFATENNTDNYLGTSLVFGQMISWGEDHVDIKGHITKFDRVPSIYESREWDGHGQILLEGAINPHRINEFYTNLFGYIPLPENVVHEPATDVYLKAWISLIIELDKKNRYSLTAEFGSFDGVCSSGKQYDVAILPWNRNDPNFANIPVKSDHNNVHEKENNEMSHDDEQKEFEFKDATAFMTGDRTLHLTDCTYGKCFLPLKFSNINWTIGGKYTVDCFWQNNMKIYYISNIRVFIANIKERRKLTEKILTCGVCSSKMTMRASYGLARLRDHVMRHLNLPTVQCGYCDYKGVLREHVKRHSSVKHEDQPLLVKELELASEFEKRFNHLWTACFPSLSDDPRTNKTENNTITNIKLKIRRGREKKQHSLKPPSVETRIEHQESMSTDTNSVDSPTCLTNSQNSEEFMDVNETMTPEDPNKSPDKNMASIEQKTFFNTLQKYFL